MDPTPWPAAGGAPHYNVIGEDPQLTDPEGGDFQILPGSPAADYGCQTFARRMPGASMRASESRSTEVYAGRLFEVSGSIDTNTMWDADTVLVVGDVTIENGVTLEISPGVRIAFDGYYGLDVLGRLLAVGTAAEPIQFTSADPTGFAVDSTTTGSWRGIRFPHTPTGNEPSAIEYAILEYCKTAGGIDRGGALSVIAFSKLRISNCIFQHNVADYGAGVYCANFAAPEVVDCLLTDNQAFVTGSVIYTLDAYPALINNTMVSNPVLNEAWADPIAALHYHISKPKTINSIIRENPSQYFLGGQIVEGKAFYTRYNNIEDGHAGEGNFDDDPLFLDQGPHPFALAEGSPCIDAGTPDTTDLKLPTLDLMGGVRIAGGRVDVGAYEWSATAGVDGRISAADRLHWAIHPNPSVREVEISFLLPVPTDVTLEIFDAAGRGVRTLSLGPAAPGRRHVRWDGCDAQRHPLAAGTYLCRLKGCRSTTKMIRIP